MRGGDVPHPRLPVGLSFDPVAADRHVVSVIRVEGHRATNLAPVAPGGTARLMGLRPGPSLEGHHDLEPSDPPLGTVPRDPPQLVGDVVEVRPGEARGAVLAAGGAYTVQDRPIPRSPLQLPLAPPSG